MKNDMRRQVRLLFQPRWGGVESVLLGIPEASAGTTPPVVQVSYADDAEAVRCLMSLPAGTTVLTGEGAMPIGAWLEQVAPGVDVATATADRSAPPQEVTHGTRRRRLVRTWYRVIGVGMVQC